MTNNWEMHEAEENCERARNEAAADTRASIVTWLRIARSRLSQEYGGHARLAVIIALDDVLLAIEHSEDMKVE